MSVQTVETLGHFLFRTRNLLFPALLIGVFILFPARPIGDGMGTVLLTGGLLMVAAGQGLRVLTIGLDYIRRGGRNGRIHADRLVTGGIFSHCRNPMYTGNILMVIGYLMVAGNPGGIIMGSVLACLMYGAIVVSEEGYLAPKFGEQYQAYRREVPQWWPRWLGIARTLRHHHFDWAAVVIREYGTLYLTALFLILLLGWKAALADRLQPALPIYIAAFAAASCSYGLARYLKKSRRLRPSGG